MQLGEGPTGKLAAVVLFVFGGMSLATSGLFLSGGNLASMTEQVPGYGLLALAMALPMITGGVDLSIVALSNLCAIAAALLLRHYLGPVPFSPDSLAVVIGVAAGAVLLGAIGGFINGCIVAAIGVTPILATLGTGLIFSGIATVITGGTAVYDLPEAFGLIASGKFVHVPVPALIFALMAISLSFVLTQTAFGTRVFLLGTNPRAARFAGVDSARVLLKTYVISGMTAALAGLVLAAGANSAKADYGQSYLLLAIVICVLGGISPTGGAGRISGVVLAVLGLQFLSSGLNLMGANNFAVELAWGGTLLLTMLIHQLRR